MKEILQPVWRGKFRYVSRAAWRRLARQRPQALGGFSADRLFQLLEDRELAEQVASRYPRPRGDWRVRCVETGQVWPSAVKAAAELHVSQAAITLAMRQARPVRVLGMRFEALREVG
jgi:PAS domain-containing protein